VEDLIGTEAEAKAFRFAKVREAMPNDTDFKTLPSINAYMRFETNIYNAWKNWPAREKVVLPYW
jgi:hypothetical protein